MVGQKSTNTDFSVGTYVWVRSISDRPYNIPRACKILSTRNKQLKVADDDGQDFWISVGSVVKILHPSSLVMTEDMIALGELEDYTILRNLHIRFICNQIYTYIGMVLVAVNPYQQLQLYGEKQMKLYKGRRITELPPHIYAIGNECYQSLMKQRKSQVIVISGETGAGKTESTKLLLDYLANLNGRKTLIETQIIQANPILEAFGNAKTIYNDNSSRFGKLVELYFNELGIIEGASIQQYLLEKSRVTLLKQGDQNYHIFYSLISGLSWDEKCQLDVKSCHQFEYLNKTDPKLPLDLRESTDLTKVKDAMKTLNFSDDDIWNILKILAAILHLGNLTYTSNVISNIEGTEIKDGLSLDNVCMLLGVQKQYFKDAFSKKTLFIQGHKTVTEVKKVQAIMTRNGFAKTLYDKLFSYIVESINKIICKYKFSDNYSVRILDIYGFENFTNNSFEQLCINYTNEHLQQIFIHHIFKMEQEVYAREGIKWEHLSFVDNEEILHLIGQNPNSLLNIIDEQSQLITGSDEALVTKTNKIHGKNKYYKKAKSDVSLSFSILHYAGEVNYSVEGFLDKNRNLLTNNCLQLIRTSSNSFMKDLFVKELKPDQPAQGKVQTVSFQYQQSLEVLLQLINSSQPYFIRCIKPNSNQKPNVFDHELCCCQLRYSGMMETARIRRTGYPVRYNYIDFVHRYSVILELPRVKKDKDYKKLAAELCKNVLGKDDYQLGKTKVFLKIKHDVSLEMARDRILEKRIKIIQKNAKMLYAKNRYRKMKEASITIQKFWRGYKARVNYFTQRRGFLRLQACIRSIQAAFFYSKLRICSINFQARCRGFLIRREISQKIKKLQIENRNDDSVSDMDAWITSIFKSALEETESSSL